MPPLSGSGSNEADRQRYILNLSFTPPPASASPFKRHHDSQTNGEVEYDVVEGIEELWEGEGVDLRVDVVGPHENPGHAVVQDCNRSKQNVTVNIRLMSS